MSNTNSEMCPDCEQKAIGCLLFHELFCYDFYVVSAPHPQNPRQGQVDMEMYDKIVKPLEQLGYKCYLGCRDTTGGENVIQALSNPITIIPITIVPVYKDRSFSAFRNLLIRPDYLDRIVFLCFDSTPIEPPAVSKNSFSISIRDPFLQAKLIRTIQTKCSKIPLSSRKTKFEMLKTCSDPQSTVSSIVSDFHRNIPFRRSDTSRVSFRIRSTTPLLVGSEAPSSSVSALRSNGGCEISIEITSKIISPDELLSYCCNDNENIGNHAANRLRKLIQKNIINFCSDHHLQLQTFEKQTRSLIEKHDSIIYTKLYFWILAAIFFRIYKCNDSNLKSYMRILTVANCKISQKPYEQLCQQVYLNLAASLHAKIKAWPDRLDTNNLYVKKFECCLAMIDVKSLTREKKPPDALIKNLTTLPWDIKHICIVSIAEKLFQKNYITHSVHFFSEICDLIGGKHWGVLLDVLERLTEYTLKNYTEGVLDVCRNLLHIIVIWTLQRQRKKNDQTSIALKLVLSKLVYHRNTSVRHFVTPLMIGKDFRSFDTSQLGSSFVKVNEDLVEICIREHIHYNCPDLTLKNEVPTKSLHSSIYEARCPEGDVLVYVWKQRTLNDLLQTNFTDDAYERFHEMSRLVQACQVHENIVACRDVPRNSVLPFLVLENGEPLLPFLHTKENQLTWFQMIQILIDITMAVHHCHSKKIILCDITPASFITVFREDGTFKIKLASFLNARSGECKDSSSTAGDNIDNINYLCIQGDSKENIAAYFSSPESLSNKMFSEYSEVWMLAAIFYSVLLYGRRPFEELAHLNVFDFVKEVISQHTASMPISIPCDLWNIIKTNLDFRVTNRILTETILQELKTYQKNLGARSHEFYTVTTVCSYINPEDILRGYVDDTGNFTLEKSEELYEGDSVDSVKLDRHLIQTVTVRMSLKTKRTILQLNHGNILKINEIKTDCYKTILVSQDFHEHVYALSATNQDISRDRLFSYLKQITLGLQELHKHNIVHCDLRCGHIYINPEKGTLKIGHVGRAVSLDGTSTYPYAIKLMPADAKKWSAPEVRNKGMYSKASDIFNLAAVFWEAISLHINTIYQNLPLEPFQNCRPHLEDYCQSVNIQDKSEDSVNKLVKYIVKCWNPNPTKRPTLDTILDAIEQLITCNARCCSTAGDKPKDDVPADNEEQEVLYETIIDWDFSIDYAWKSVVNEFEASHGLQHNTEPFMEFMEQSTYEDIGVPLRTKPHSRRGIIL